ncbi:ATP-binding cassette domain-containing protein, partial [Acidovorax sp.]|uniref:ATP-binding cassette domain-containing protein n=1 Tax=Acidovorax sp. TaxID=1872122 RepID=UPI0025BBA567
SVYDNVALPLLIAGTPGAEVGKRVRAMLDKVGLGERERSLPMQLSTGEQQRVGIARAIIAQPQLLVADEPTGNLDPTTAARVMDLLLAQTREHGASLVLVTHSDAAAARADRVLRLTADGIATD